jgi:gluconolactonase
MQMTRRQMLARAGASAIAATASPAFAAWEENARYPDPRVQVLDPSFIRYRVTNASVERLYTGTRWAEGPLWMGDWRCLLWSDGPNNRIMRWDEITGRTTVYREPSASANGNARDCEGRLVTCEQSNRRVTRTEHNGSITVLIDKFDGKRLNAPNDVVVRSDGTIWFSDPSARDADPSAVPELPNNVYRLDPKTGRTTVAATDLRPNGLAFSPDGKVLFLADNDPTPRLIRAYDVMDDGKLANPRVVVRGDGTSIFDGFRIDAVGNFWCGAGGGEDYDGVAVYNPQGKKIAKILLPERCANLCFGGMRRNRLFMAASHSIYALYTNTSGADVA